MGSVLHTLADQVGASERTLRRALSDGVIRGHRPSAYKVELLMAERAYIREHWALLAELREGLRREPAVECAVLFGSVARGDDGPESDVDLLVWIRPGGDRLAVARRLTTRLGRPVQVIDVREVAGQPGILVSALRDGRPVVDRAGRWPQLREQAPALRRRAARSRRLAASQAARAREFFESAAGAL